MGGSFYHRCIHVRWPAVADPAKLLNKIHNGAFPVYGHDAHRHLLGVVRLRAHGVPEELVHRRRQRARSRVCAGYARAVLYLSREVRRQTTGVIRSGVTS